MISEPFKATDLPTDRLGTAFPQNGIGVARIRQ